ncbi:MAG: hypothetical protein KatS3mg110_1806 [Pirellulaceae bacterium]|nr:MAG: hypothetical protein KatS3mg110_1806 [Pirellulaceae bacterium]
MSSDWIRARLMWLAFLLAALGVPWFLSESGTDSERAAPSHSERSPARGNSTGSLTRSDANGLSPMGTVETRFSQPPAQRAGPHEDGAALPESAMGIPTSSTIPLVQALEELIRFDWTPDALLERFHRVSTVAADDQLSGLRVVWVSGTRPEDLAGSLTYYFDTQHRLQRISFIGQTGDYQPLVMFLQSRFHLEPRESRAAGLWLVLWNGQPTSALLVERAAVIRADDPLGRYQIWFELNRPRNYGRLSLSFAERLETVRLGVRW